MSHNTMFTCLVCPTEEGLPRGMGERSKEELVGKSGPDGLRAGSVGCRSLTGAPGYGVRLAQLRVWLAFTGTLPSRNWSSLNMSLLAFPKALLARKAPAISLAFCCLAFPSQGSAGDQAPKNPSLAPALVGFSSLQAASCSLCSLTLA